MKKNASLSLILALVFVALVFVAQTGMAQTKSAQHSPPLFEGMPSSVGMSAERLARIDAMCEEAVAKSDVPGMVAIVARHGQIIFHKAYGMADNQAGRAMQKDDIFRIASQTKAITATAVMMLWEEGHFQLDDPISNWIPGFKNAGVLKTYNSENNTWTTEPAKTPITIRHLLTHTSGLGYGVIDDEESFQKIYAQAGITDLYTVEPVTIAENVQKLAKLPLHHHPGERFTYSEGLDVLGYFIEIISGKPFDVFLRERLFDPLDMQDTYFYLPKEKEGRLVTIQKPENGTWVRYPVTFYDPDFPIKGAKTFFSGGAGLCSTAKDYATFLQMYLNNGELNGIRILSRTTIETMMSNQTGNLYDGEEKNNYYGLANEVLTVQGQAKGGLGSPGTFDWGGYFNTQYFANPQEGLIGLILKQTEHEDENTGRKFRILVGQAVDD